MNELNSSNYEIKKQKLWDSHVQTNSLIYEESHNYDIKTKIWGGKLKLWDKVATVKLFQKKRGPRMCLNKQTEGTGTRDFKGLFNVEERWMDIGGRGWGGPAALEGRHV